MKNIKLYYRPAEFEILNKRTHLPLKVTADCDCGKHVEENFEQYHNTVQYLTLNGLNKVYLFCKYCDAGQVVMIRLDLVATLA